jgi:hypothetical protein
MLCEFCSQISRQVPRASPQIFVQEGVETNYAHI